MTAALLLGFLCILIWLYLLLGRGGFWMVPHISLPYGDVGPHPRIVAIVPARNEAEVIGRSVRSLLDQVGLDLHLILIDDHSDDDTASEARNAAGVKENCLTVITAPPLPDGWSGKLWAVQQGIEEAQKRPADFYLLTDADIEHAPANVSSLVSIANAGQHDLASYMVKLHCATLSEKLLIPAFVYFFFQLYPPAWISNPKAKTAGAAGGCILVRPDALQRAGAMQSIRSEIIDDCALAREVKRTGGRVWLGLTESATSIRPYRFFAEIERMIARTAFNQLGHSPLMLVVAIFGLLLTYIAPTAVFFSCPWLGAIASALMLISYYPMIRFYRLNPIWTVTLPLAAIFYMCATLDSAIRYWTGKGGQWKGRAQDQPAGAPDA